MALITTRACDKCKKPISDENRRVVRFPGVDLPAEDSKRKSFTSYDYCKGCYSAIHKSISDLCIAYNGG